MELIETIAGFTVCILVSTCAFCGLAAIVDCVVQLFAIKNDFEKDEDFYSMNVTHKKKPD